MKNINHKNFIIRYFVNLEGKLNEPKVKNFLSVYKIKIINLMRRFIN